MNHYEIPPEKCPDYIYKPENMDERTEDNSNRRGTSNTKLAELEE